MIKIIELTETNYQGNGEAVGFYSALMKWKEDDNTYSNFLITFETDGETDSIVNDENIRVVDLSNLQESWRGNYFVEPLQLFLNTKRSSNDSVYDFMKPF